MKLNTLVIGAALVAAGAMVSAQTAFHGYVDYTNYGVGQEFTKTGDADYAASSAAAEYGNTDNGLTQFDVNVNTSGIAFNFGVRLNASMGDWNNYYYSAEGGTTTPFYQGNMKVNFLNDQIFLYTGKFESWNAGYITDGYVFGSQNISNLADHSQGQHLTAVEYAPTMIQAIKGLKLIAGIPILPVSGNGVDTTAAYNQWQYLYKKAKFAVAYTVPGDMGLSFNAGFRPGTYYSGVYVITSSATTAKSDWITNYYSEGYVQANLLNAIPGVKLNASYDIRYRDASYTNVLNETTTHFAMAHMFGVSAEVKPLDALTVAVENRFFYAGDDYVQSDEKLFYNVFGTNAAYKLAGTQYEVGVGLDCIYAQDARGKAFTSGEVSSDYFDSIALSINSMSTATLPASGTAGKYIVGYFNPYVQRNFANGYARFGIEAQYARFETSTVNQAISYRIPVGLVFKF